MATLQAIIPDELYQELEQRARHRNSSIDAEVVQLLKRALEGKKPSQGELLDDIRRRRLARPIDPNDPSSTALLREDRDR